MDVIHQERNSVMWMYAMMGDETGREIIRKWWNCMI